MRLHISLFITVLPMVRYGTSLWQNIQAPPTIKCTPKRPVHHRGKYRRGRKQWTKPEKIGEHQLFVTPKLILACPTTKFREHRLPGEFVDSFHFHSSRSWECHSGRHGTRQHKPYIIPKTRTFLNTIIKLVLPQPAYSKLLDTKTVWTHSFSSRYLRLGW